MTVFSQHVKIREEKFGAVVFDTLKEKVFVANETGRDILSLLEKGYSQDKIVDILACDYGIEPSDIKDDINGFIGRLRDNNIVDRQT